MKPDLNEQDALLVLNGLSHIGPILLRRLLDAFSDSAVAVLSADRAEWLCVEGIGPAAANTLRDWSAHLTSNAKKTDLPSATYVSSTGESRAIHPPCLKPMIPPSVFIGKVPTLLSAPVSLSLVLVRLPFMVCALHGNSLPDSPASVSAL